MFEQLVDFFIRHQTVLFLLLGGLVGGPFTYRALTDEIAAEHHARSYYLTNRIRIPMRRRLSSPSIFMHRRLLWVAIAIIVSTGTLSYSKPIHSTAALSLPRFVRQNPTNTRLLLFIHGWNGDPNDTWEAFPKIARDDPKLTSFDILSISYPTYHLRRNLSLSELVGWLADRFRTDGLWSRYTQISVIAHSMGGIVARELVVQSRLSTVQASFNVLVEIGTPHEGADLARLAEILGVAKGFTKDIAPGAPFLRDLRLHWNSLDPRPETFCISSPHDLVVSEQSATAQCDRFGNYPQWSHREIVKPLTQGDDRYRMPIGRIVSAISVSPERKNEENF